MNTIEAPVTADEKERIHSIREDYIREAFGDEIARVSKLSLDERYRYVAWMVDNGKRHGVKHDKPALGVTL